VPNYSSFEVRPLHPETGEPAAYYWVENPGMPNEVRHPRWDSKRRGARAMTKAVAENPSAVLLTTAEAAALLGVDIGTVRRWCVSGRIAGVKGGGVRPHWRIRGSELAAFGRREPKVVPVTTEFRRASR